MSAFDDAQADFIRRCINKAQSNPTVPPFVPSPPHVEDSIGDSDDFDSLYEYQYRSETDSFSETVSLLDNTSCWTIHDDFDTNEIPS